jgi:hypothetical protein
MAGFTLAGFLVVFIILTFLEYYHIWKQGQRKLKELDSYKIIQGLTKNKGGRR